MGIYEIGLVITIPSFIFIFTCLKTLQFLRVFAFLYIFKYQSLNVVLYNTIIRLICLHHNSKVLSKSFPGKAIFPFTDLKRQQKAVFTAFCFRISSAYYFVFVMVFLDLRYFSITMIADNARTIPIPVPITGA